MQLKRQTAYKFWIGDLLSGEQKLNNDGMRYFLIKGKDVVRVNVISVAISMYENSDAKYAAITLDDGSGNIRMKVWEDDFKILQGIGLGDVILVIGRLYEQNNEIFLRPEIVRKMDVEWMKARNAELKREHGSPSIVEDKKLEVIEEKVEEKIEPSVLAREKVFLIVGNAPDEGIEISELIARSGMKEDLVEKAVDELLREGEVFSPRAGFVKLV